MSGFLYFVPGKTAGGQVDLAELGLDGVFPPGKAPAGACMEGPGGDRGWLMAIAPKQFEDFRYSPNAQEWHRAMGGAFWVGWDKQDKPKPANLQRERLLDGHPIILADGNSWQIPVARLAGMTTGYVLPKVMGLDEDGNPAETVESRYQMLAEAADIVYSAQHGDGGTVLPYEEVERIAVGALSANYRIGRWGIRALGILTTENMKDILLWLIDWPTLKRFQAELAAQAAQKKNDATEPETATV